MFKSLIEFYGFLGKVLKRRLIRIQFLIITSSVLETLSVLSIGPFMSFVASPELISTSNLSKYFLELFNISDSSSFLFFLGSMILILMVISALVAMLNVWKLSHLGGDIGADLSIRMYRHYINQSLPYHLKTNTSEIASKLIVESNRVTHSIVMQFLHLNSKIVLILMMTITILITVPIIAILGTTIFAISYILMFRFASKRLNRNGEAISQETQRRMQTINESFGGIKDVLIHDLREVFTEKYKKSTKNYYSSWRSTQVLSLLPRYAMELAAYGTIITATLFLLATYENNIEKVLPVIAVFGLASMKILPAFQQCYFSISTIRANVNAFLVVRDELENIHRQEKFIKAYDRPDNFIPFLKSVNLNDVSFRYNENSDYVVKNVSLNFHANETTGLVGPSGSGKSTIVNILTGLLPPSEGKITIDGQELNNDKMRSWQQRIGYVSQDIFLTDTSIKENIAFGFNFNEINDDRLDEAVKMAKLDEFVSTLPLGLDTGVGERGVQLSGGQLQRVGIARALYTNPEIIIFDEATSNLDRISEKLIMETISSLGKSTTIVMIAHRLSTVKKCDNIFLLNNGQVEDSGDYQYLIKNNPKFVDLT